MKKFRLVKSFLCLGLIGCLIASDSIISDATRSISEIEEEQDALQDEIDALDADLYNLVLEIEEISVSIDDTQAEIEATQESLAEAQEACETKPLQPAVEAEKRGVALQLAAFLVERL